MATDHDSTLSQHVMRRLQGATSFKGKLKCTFDPQMPLNVTDLTQPFMTSCKTPSEGMSDWWWLLIIVGSMVALFIGTYVALFVYGSVAQWWAARKERRAKEALAARTDAKLAACNDYVVSVDS